MHSNIPGISNILVMTIFWIWCLHASEKPGPSYPCLQGQQQCPGYLCSRVEGGKWQMVTKNIYFYKRQSFKSHCTIYRCVNFLLLHIKFAQRWETRILHLHVTVSWILAYSENWNQEMVFIWHKQNQDTFISLYLNHQDTWVNTLCGM